MEQNQKLLLTKVQYQDTTLNQIEEDIKRLKLDKKTTVRTILNLMLQLTKDLSNIDTYSKMNKKGRLTVAYNKLDLQLSSKTSSKIVKSVFIYLSSNSSLNFNDVNLSTSRFIKGMSTINNPANKVTRFKSNQELISTLKALEIEKLKAKVDKLSNK